MGIGVDEPVFETAEGWVRAGLRWVKTGEGWLVSYDGGELGQGGGDGFDRGRAGVGSCGNPAGKRGNTKSEEV